MFITTNVQQQRHNFLDYQSESAVCNWSTLKSSSSHHLRPWQSIKWQRVSSPGWEVFIEIYYRDLLTVSLEKACINLLKFCWSITFNWLCWALIVKIGWKTKRTVLSIFPSSSLHPESKEKHLCRILAHLCRICLSHDKWHPRSLFGVIIPMLNTRGELVSQCLWRLISYITCLLSTQNMDRTAGSAAHN